MRQPKEPLAGSNDTPREAPQELRVSFGPEVAAETRTRFLDELRAELGLMRDRNGSQNVASQPTEEASPTPPPHRSRQP